MLFVKLSVKGSVYPIQNSFDLLVKSLIIHKENTNEIMSVKEPVYPDTEFDFLALYKNYFADKSIKLESFTSHLQHSRPCCIRYTTLAFGSSLYMLIQHGRSCCK